MLSRCFHFGVFEIFVSSLFLLVLFAFLGVLIFSTLQFGSRFSRNQYRLYPSTNDLFTTRISERQESVFRRYGSCLTWTPLSFIGGTKVLLPGRKSALILAKKCPSLGTFRLQRDKNICLAFCSLISLLQKMFVLVFI